MPYESDLPPESSPLEHLKRGKVLFKNKKLNTGLIPTEQHRNFLKLSELEKRINELEKRLSSLEDE
jgi:ABC-type phosphate transport system auxiliary subunit